MHSAAVAVMSVLSVPTAVFT